MLKVCAKSPCRVCWISWWVSRHTIGWPKFQLLFYSTILRGQGVKVLQSESTRDVHPRDFDTRYSTPIFKNFLYFSVFPNLLLSTFSVPIKLRAYIYIYYIYYRSRWGVDTKIQESNGYSRRSYKRYCVMLTVILDIGDNFIDSLLPHRERSNRN